MNDGTSKLHSNMAIVGRPKKFIRMPNIASIAELAFRQESIIFIDLISRVFLLRSHTRDIFEIL